MMLKLKYKEEEKKKEAFYCSDFGKLDIDIYFSFVGETKTNPVSWNDTLKWGAGKGAEMAMLELLKSNGITANDYDQEKHGRVEIERLGVKIHGYMDAMTNGERVKDFGLTENSPIEIKTINNANKFDIKKYEDNNPRENYVGQLAIYMDSQDKEVGYLFACTIDGLHTFWFECRKVGDGKYKCGNTEVDLNKEYERWQNLKTHVDEGLQPECPIRYKIPVGEVNWKSLSKTDITKARNNKKVIGDEGSWQIQYSSWKDKIIEIQGATLGYDDKELKIIKEATAGFTKW